MHILAALVAREAWANMPWEQRAGIFLKAAELAAKRIALYAERFHDAGYQQDRLSS